MALSRAIIKKYSGLWDSVYKRTFLWEAKREIF